MEHGRNYVGSNTYAGRVLYGARGRSERRLFPEVQRFENLGPGARPGWIGPDPGRNRAGTEPGRTEPNRIGPSRASMA